MKAVTAVRRPSLAQLALAFRARPRLALAGLWALLWRRKIRAANLIGQAAAEHPSYYSHWVREHETAVIARWLDEHPHLAQPFGRVAVLVVGPDGAERTTTLVSLERALPGHLLLDQAASLDQALDAARTMTCGWLLALRAGTTLSPELGSVLSRVDPAGAALVYWDCDRWEGGHRADPLIKPDWDPWLLRSHDLLGEACLLSVQVASARLPTLGLGSPASATVAELQLASASADMITPLHVPLILTHLAESAPLLQQDWRETALHPDGHASADQWPSAPGVSIIVPTRDEACMLAGLVSLLDRLSYSGPVELLVVDNGSVEPATAKLFEQLEHRPATRVLAMPGPFNFAALINQAASQSSHDYLCLLNNDVEPRDGEWLERMMHEAVRPGVGAVGARLLYPDGTIQHVGVAVGLGGAAGHVQKGVHPDTSQFNSWHGALRRVSAVTAACLVVSKAKFDAVGGLDAEAFAVDFNDVDFCLKLDRAGWANLVEPAATLLHHESKSRGRGHRGAAEHRFALELTVLQDRWQTRTMIDPWFSSLFSRTSERCVLST